MKIKILKHKDEKKINKEIERLEKDRNIENVFPFKNETWILFYPEYNEFEKELILLRKDLAELKKENKK